MALTQATAGHSETYAAQPANFKATLSEARAGDTVLLAPGAYAVLGLYRDYGGVTLKSADPANPARFTALSAKGARGVTMEDLVFDYTYAQGDSAKRLKVSEITRSGDITLRRVLFDGDVATGTGNSNEGYGASFGVTLRETDNVLIEDSRLHQWYRGMVVSQSRNFTLRGTEFHEMRSDGVDFVAVTDVLVENNYFHDFHRHADSKDHPDMIQFWTNGSKTPSRNIIIRNNVLNTGHGAWTQSIFMRNEVVDSQGGGTDMFYRNLTITGNVIINAHLHGITVGETDGLMIADNTLIRNQRALLTNSDQGLHTPTIRIAKNSTNVLVTRNIVSKIVGPEKQRNWRVSNNLHIQSANPQKPGYYDDVFVAALHGDPATLAPFTYLPDGPAGKTGFGAPLLRLTGDNIASAVLVQVTQDPQLMRRFTFEARLNGSAARTDIAWQFSDGTTATGPSVTHKFPGPGTFEVVAQAPGAQPALLSIEVPDPQILQLYDTGLYSFKKGAAHLIDEVPLTRLPEGGTALAVGQGRDVVGLHQGYITGFFGALDFALDLRLRAEKTQNPTGEILRIHNNLILTMTAQGQIFFWLNTAKTPKPVSISTGPLRLHDGKWHDIGLRYSAQDGRMSVIVDGVEQARTQAIGPLRPMESWGLSLGNPFGKKSFDGVISQLDLRSNTVGFAPE